MNLHYASNLKTNQLDNINAHHFIIHTVGVRTNRSDPLSKHKKKLINFYCVWIIIITRKCWLMILGLRNSNRFFNLVCRRTIEIIKRFIVICDSDVFKESNSYRISFSIILTTWLNNLISKTDFIMQLNFTVTTI